MIESRVLFAGSAPTTRQRALQLPRKFETNPVSMIPLLFLLLFFIVLRLPLSSFATFTIGREGQWDTLCCFHFVNINGYIVPAHVLKA